MATPLIDTTPVTTHYPLALGSGSLTLPTPVEVGSPTGFALPVRVLFRLTDLLQGFTTSTSPEVRLREKHSDPVGTWLASTQDMLLEVPTAPPGTYARALDELKADLGVTLTYVARCLGMQRSAVYRWYDGRSPHPANRARLETIREFGKRWRTARLPPLRNYWESTLPGTSRTLGDLLSSPTLDVAMLETAIDNLAHHTAAIPSRPPRLGFPARRRNRERERERLSVLNATTSHEDEEKAPE
jgi:hypothetical protein